MINQKKATQKLHEAFAEMFHQSIIYEEGPKKDTKEEVYVDSHPGTSFMLQHVERFINGETCLGEVINAALELQDLYGSGYGLSPTEYPSLKPEVPSFVHQLAYLINSVLFDGTDKSDIYKIGFIDTDIHSSLSNYCSNYIYELTVEALQNFCNTTSFTFDSKYYQQWTKEEMENASEKYPLLLEKYMKYQERLQMRQRTYAKLLPDVKVDQEQYKDFDYESYVKDTFPLTDGSENPGYFRNAYETNGCEYFDITEIYKNNPMFVTLLRRNYTSEEFDMYKEIDPGNNPYSNFWYAIWYHLFNGKRDECESDFKFFEEFMRTSTPTFEDSTKLFATEEEKNEYMSIAWQCWEKLKHSTIDYGNHATSLSSTANIKRCLLAFAMLSSKHKGVLITDGKNNQVFEDGSYQEKTGDYNLVALDTLGVEGASFHSSELNKQRLAMCFKQIFLSEVREQALEQRGCPPAVTRKNILTKPSFDTDSQN